MEGDGIACTGGAVAPWTLGWCSPVGGMVLAAGITAEVGAITQED